MTQPDLDRGSIKTRFYTLFKTVSVLIAKIQAPKRTSAHQLISKKQEDGQPNDGDSDNDGCDIGLVSLKALDGVCWQWFYQVHATHGHSIVRHGIFCQNHEHMYRLYDRNANVLNEDRRLRENMVSIKTSYVRRGYSRSDADHEIRMARYASERGIGPKLHWAAFEESEGEHGRLVLVMEKMHVTLEAKLLACNGWTPQIVTAVRSLIVVRAATARFVHNDMHYANIIFDGDDNAFFIDFHMTQLIPLQQHYDLNAFSCHAELTDSNSDSAVIKARIGVEKRDHAAKHPSHFWSSYQTN